MLSILLGVAVFTVIMGVLAVFLVGAIITARAPTFGAQKDTGLALNAGDYMPAVGVWMNMSV